MSLDQSEHEGMDGLSEAVSLSANLDEQRRFAVDLRVDPQAQKLHVVLRDTYLNGRLDSVTRALLSSNADGLGYLTLNVNGEENSVTYHESTDQHDAAIGTWDVPISAARESLISVRCAGETLTSFTYDPQSHQLKKGKERPFTAFELKQVGKLHKAGFLENDWKSAREEAEKADYKPLADLHTHFAGQVPVEGLMTISMKSNTPYPVALLQKEGIELPPGYSEKNIGFGDLVKFLMDTDHGKRKLNSIRALKRMLTIPAGQTINFMGMEDIYIARGPLTKDVKNFAPLLREIALEYQKKGTSYVELSLSDIVRPTWLAEACRVLPEIERETGVKLRFMVGLWRHNSPDYNNEVIKQAVFVAHECPEVVTGIDFMGHETNATQDFTAQIKFAADHNNEVMQGRMKTGKQVRPYPFQIRVHAGENPLFASMDPYLPNNVRDAINAGATRIGHGINGADEETVKLAREKGVIIEFNLSSNNVLNNVEGRRDSIAGELPIQGYIDAGARVTLGSDGSLYGGGGMNETQVARLAGLKSGPGGEEAIKKSDQEYIGMMTPKKGATVPPPRAPAPEEFPAFNFDEGTYWKNYNEEQRRLRKELETYITTLTYNGEPVHFIDIPKKQVSNGVGDDGKERFHAEDDESQLDQFFRGRVPILFSGGSVKSWDKNSKVTDQDKEQVRSEIRSWLAMLDPEQVVIMTGGTNCGAEKIVHEEVRRILTEESARKGFDVLGTGVVKDMDKIEANTLTHAVFVSDEWYRKSAPVLQMVKRRKGFVIFIGGGNILNDEIQAARNADIPFYLMKGPDGVSNTKAISHPDHAFRARDSQVEGTDTTPTMNMILKRDWRHLLRHLEPWEQTGHIAHSTQSSVGRILNDSSPGHLVP